MGDTLMCLSPTMFGVMGGLVSAVVLGTLSFLVGAGTRRVAGLVQYLVIPDPS